MTLQMGADYLRPLQAALLQAIAGRPRVIVRYALFEGEIHAGRESAFRTFVKEQLVPRWTNFLAPKKSEFLNVSCQLAAAWVVPYHWFASGFSRDAILLVKIFQDVDGRKFPLRMRASQEPSGWVLCVNCVAQVATELAMVFK